MTEKGHMIGEKFDRILGLRANLHLGISEKLKIAFPEIIAVARPEVPLRLIPNSQWLTGFIDGEGCLHIKIQKYKFKTNNEKTDKV